MTSTRQIEITRAIRGATKAGLAWGTYKVTCEDGRVTILPIKPGEAEANDLDAEIERLFGDGDDR